MSEVNLSGIEHSLRDIYRELGSLEQQVGRVDNRIDYLTGEVSEIQSDLAALIDAFKKMADDQKRAAALQKAISELIRVRQEIGQKYGSYSVVRETMLGVLQATDLALVKKTTISRVSEELMLSTPNYWLSPCLIAVAGWISNDRDLAQRAITEALKRDEEKTALAMALICRRNGRVDTGYEWLSLYFSKQNANSITEEAFTYIDAYINGVFGPDDKHQCDGYVAKWVNDIRGNKSDFEAAQEAKWEEYCKRFRIDVKKLYPDLSEIASESKQINNCIGSIYSFGTIRENFRNMAEAFVDQETMKKAIDTELVRLISNYDASEVDIRREEEYLSLVKQNGGDEEVAKKEMLIRENKRRQHQLDLFEQMASSITGETHSVPSKRRTALTFLSNYINRGYSNYIENAKKDFPNIINLNIENWHGQTSDGTDFNRLAMEFQQSMNQSHEEAINHAINGKPKALMIWGIILLVAAIPAIFLTHGWFIPVLLAAAGGGCFISRMNAIKNTQKNIEKINADFNARTNQGMQKLDGALRQLQNARSIIRCYDDEGTHTVA